MLETLGATWEEVSLPHSKYALATYYLLSSSEASANLARFDGVRYGYRAENAENLIEIYSITCRRIWRRSETPYYAWNICIKLWLL